MKPIVPILLALGGLLAYGPVAQARTWHVEKDGSGDFTVIQEAVDGASPGDTIRLGPGRWTDCHFVDSVDAGQNVYVHVQVDSLTIIGSGQDQSIIGPTSPIHLPTERPKGILAMSEVTSIVVESLTIENVRDGWYKWLGALAVRRCVFRGCSYGLVMWADHGSLIEECCFVDSPYANGIISWDPGRDIIVRRCLFSNVGKGLDFNTVNAVVTDCTFSGGIVGAQFVFAATGDITNCVFEETITNYSLALRTLANVHLTNNRILGGGCHLWVDSGASVSGSGNIFTGSDFATIWASGGFPALTGNHILHGLGPTVLVQGFPDAPQRLNMEGNYWGTSSPDSIAAWITDGNDTPEVHAVVDFEPFSATPLAAEKKSLGGVKGLYR